MPDPPPTKDAQLDSPAEALRASEQHFRSLIENALDLVSILSAEGAFQYASPSNERILGYRPEELTARDAFAFVHPDDAARTREAFSRAVQHPGVTPTLQFRFRHKDGSWRFIEAIGNSLLDTSGLVRVVINARDITDRVLAEEAQRAEAQVSQALARVGRELITALDTPRLLDRLCHVTAEVLQCDTSHTLLWQPEEDVFRPIAGYGATSEEQEAARLIKVPRGLMSELLSRLERDEVAQVGTTPPDLLSQPEQQRLGVTLTLCMALRKGSQLIGVQVARSRRCREPFTETQRRIARGIAQVASLAIEHERVMQELERANRLKSDFVATMSHELRTPLSAISGYTDLLLEGAFGTLTEEQAETLQRVQRNAAELLALIRATLDLSRLEAGQVHVEIVAVDPADLIAQLEQETRELAQRSGLHFVWKVGPDLPQVETDPAKVKLILKNLIGNAVKFTEKGTVTIGIQRCEEGVEVTVSDTGIGIAPRALGIIFEPFRQADSSSTRRHGGVGLGLYIVRRLLEMLGGSVNVDSEVGRGSTFRVHLPKCPPTHQGNEPGQ
jgi:PAS domain S-box-containing protein